MKNSEQKEPKAKVNLKDIQKIKQMREHDAFLLPDGSKYWADRISIDQLATHADCCDCGVEFEKSYTHQRRCEDCDFKKDAENFSKLPLVEWDGETPLVIWGDDRYFFSEDDIDEYCEENEISKDQLKLEICKETSFGEVNVSELFMDELHEDWDYPKELAELEDQLNKWLKNNSTNTWVGAGKRVQL
jgi:hypothetical protein